MSKTTIARVLVTALVSLFGGRFAVSAQGAQAPKETIPKVVPPVLCGGLKEVSVVIDPGADTANAQVEFCHPGTSGANTTPAVVSALDFTSRMTQMKLGARVLFSRQNEASSGESIKLDAIPPGEVRTIKVDVSRIWEAGEAEAPLRVNGTEVGKLVARKYRLPFGVKVDAPNPDQPEFALQRGKPYNIELKNSDAVTYAIAWELRIAGHSENGSSVVTPNQSATFAINGENAGYFDGLTGLLKDHDEDGKLTLSFRPPGVANGRYWPSKVVTIKVHLRTVSESARSWLIGPLLLFVLFMGALFSYLASVGLPNRLRRSEHSERLMRVGQRLGSISHDVDSRLRVAIRVQRKRLSDLLHSRSSISADLTNVFNQVADGTAALERQVSLAEQIDDVHRRLRYLDIKNAPPSLLAEAEDTVWKAAEEIGHVGPDDHKIEKSKAYLARADELMTAADDYKQEFAANLAARALTGQALLAPYLMTDVCTQIVTPALGALLIDQSAPAVPKTLEETAALDRKQTKRDLLRQFLQIHQATPNGEVRDKLDAQLRRLISVLGLDSYKTVRRARLLVRESQEGVYPGDLARTGSSAHIKMDPTAPRPNDPVRFSVSFDDPMLNDTAARLEYEGRWSFGHDDANETGWDLVHYFPHDGSFDVTFAAVSGVVDQGLSARRQVTVRRGGERWWGRDRNRAELLRFFVTLVPAIVGLASGAREQFLKLDSWSAVFAVFLLGFGSDTVKNLVSQSQQPPAKPVTQVPAAATAAPPNAAPNAPPTGS
jgi:hypothetical protein